MIVTATRAGDGWFTCEGEYVADDMTGYVERQVVPTSIRPDDLPGQFYVTYQQENQL